MNQNGEFMMKIVILIFLSLVFCQSWALKKTSFLVKKEVRMEMASLLNEFVHFQEMLFLQQESRAHVHLAKIKRHISKLLRFKDPDWTYHHYTYVRNRLHYLSQLLSTLQRLTPSGLHNLKLLNKEFIHLARVFGNKVKVSYCLADRSVWINNVGGHNTKASFSGWGKGRVCGVDLAKKRIVSFKD